MALGVARGLAELHARNFIHCDLKSPNILLTREGVLFRLYTAVLKELQL